MIFSINQSQYHHFVLILSALIVVLEPSWSIFRSQIPNPFPQPNHPVGNRTAVILSGQLRVGNMSILSPNVRGYMGTNIQKFFGGDDPPTPIATHLEHFLRVLGLYGGVDMFIFIQADHRMINGSDTWDGNPDTYEVRHRSIHLSTINWTRKYSEVDLDNIGYAWRYETL